MNPFVPNKWMMMMSVYLHKLVRYMWASMKFFTAPSCCHHRTLAHNHITPGSKRKPNMWLAV